MTEHVVDAADEARHGAEAEQLWQESWYADVITPDGSVAAYIRLGLYPNLGAAWWHVAVLGPGRPVVVCQRTDLAVPADGLAISTDDVSIELAVDEALESFTVRGAMWGSSHAAATDIYDGKPGDPVQIEVDLTWATEGSPYQYAVTTRYEIPCAVTGTVTIDGEQLRLDGPGQRDHSWGVRDWWSFGWCWSSGHLTDGTHVHMTEVRLPDFTYTPGYVQRDGDVVPVGTGSVTEDLDDEGFARSATVTMDDLEVAVEPIAYGPLLLVAPDGRVGRFPRAATRLRTADGRQGLGWIEWNQPPAG
jgi:hypothetical protein